MIVDSQVHAYDPNWPNTPRYDFLQEGNGDQMVEAMREVGVDAAVLVAIRGDSTFAESVFRDYPERFRLVVPIDPETAGVTERVAEWAATPGAVGIRLLCYPPDRFDAGDPGVVAAIEGAAAGGLVVNVQCWDRLDLADELAKRFPDVQLVIDHVGLKQPISPPAPADVFENLPKVLALARYPNVAVKVSGACTYSRRPYPYDDLWEPLGRLIDAFGVDRCMWGTDWNRTTKLVSYEQGVGAFRDHWPLSASDKAALMGETVLQIYHWAEHSLST